MEYGMEEPVDDREAQLYREYFDAEQIAGERARDAVLRAAEKRVADLIFNTTTWTGDTFDGTKWTDPALGTPITDVETAVQAVYTASGLIANTLILPWKTFRDARLTVCMQHTGPTIGRFG